MDDKTLTAKAEFLVKEARLDADAFRENTVYNADGDAIRLIANAERLEQYADTIEAQATRNEALEAALRDAAKAERDRIVAWLRSDKPDRDNGGPCRHVEHSQGTCICNELAEALESQP